MGVLEELKELEKRKVHVGMKVRRKTVYGESEIAGGLKKSYTGTVVYIHPEGRYHMVEFQDGLRECYAGTDIDAE